MKKLFALGLLSLTLAACEPASTDNTNSNTKPAAPATSTPAPVTPTPEASPAVKAQVKAGDKVKVTINGTATEATVVSVDEKAGKVTVRIAGQKEDKTVAIADLTKD